MSLGHKSRYYLYSITISISIIYRELLIFYAGRMSFPHLHSVLKTMARRNLEYKHRENVTNKHFCLRGRTMDILLSSFLQVPT